MSETIPKFISSCSPVISASVSPAAVALVCRVTRADAMWAELSDGDCDDASAGVCSGPAALAGTPRRTPAMARDEEELAIVATPEPKDKNKKGRTPRTPSKTYGGVGGLLVPVEDGGREYRGRRGGRGSNKLYPDQNRLKEELPAETLAKVLPIVQEEVVVSTSGRVVKGGFDRVRSRLPELHLPRSTLVKCLNRRAEILEAAEKTRVQRHSGRQLSTATRGKQAMGKRLSKTKRGRTPSCQEVMWELGAWFNQAAEYGNRPDDYEFLLEYISRLEEHIDRRTAQESDVVLASRPKAGQTIADFKKRLELCSNPETSQTMLKRAKIVLGLTSFGVQKATDLDEQTRTFRAMCTWQHFDALVRSIVMGDFDTLGKYVADN